MVTCAVSNKSTQLQIAIGGVFRSKPNIELLHTYGVKCSYAEVLCFKSSATHAAAKTRENIGISFTGGDLIQTVADNYDANISPPNSLKSTHSLAILLTQPQPDEQNSPRDSSTGEFHSYPQLMTKLEDAASHR